MRVVTFKLWKALTLFGTL